MNAAQMRKRCVDKPVLIGPGLLRGYRFYIDSRGYSSIAKNEDEIVYGVLWGITKCCEKSLDRHEGVDGGFYFKKTVEVVDVNGSSVRALAYISSTDGTGLPNKGYMGKILDGAGEHGLPTSTSRAP